MSHTKYQNYIDRNSEYQQTKMTNMISDLEHLCEEPHEKKPIDGEFFESLWPLILDENPCRVESETTEFFVPRMRFNQLHWHTLLSNVGFPGYEQPHDLRCCGAARRHEESEEEAVQVANALAQQQTTAAMADYEPAESCSVILPVDMQVNRLRQQHERRQRLAYKFANRKYPWTMQTPSHELEFYITPELRAKFPCKMEQEMLESIHHFNCEFMLIDVGNDVCAEDLKRWIKFRPYVQMLAMVRCPRVERHLQLMTVFQTMFIEENIINTWHQELESSMYMGFKEAQTRGMLKNCGDAFLFVFSRYRGICTCDTYKVLRYN